MKRTIIALAILFTASLAYSATAVPGLPVTRHPAMSVCYNASGTTVGTTCTTPILDGIALNATASARTVVVPLYKKFNKVLVTTELTQDSATTLDIAVTMTQNGSGEASIQAGSISSGTRTLSTFVDQRPNVSESIDIETEYGVAGYDSITFVWSGTSGGASDLIDVYITAVSE